MATPYNAPLNYNAPINYNGTGVIPPPPVITVVGGMSPTRRHRKREPVEPFDMEPILHAERLMRDDEELILLLSNL